MSIDAKLVTVHSLGRKKRYIVNWDRQERRNKPQEVPSRYCVIAVRGEKAGGYFGPVLWIDDKTLIVATYEPGTDGHHASKYLLVPRHLRKRALLLDRAWKLKRLWHQLNQCECSDHNDQRCPAQRWTPFSGSAISIDELKSIPYLGMYNDNALLNDDLEFMSPRWSSVKDAIQNPTRRQSLIDSIKEAGDYATHRLRHQDMCRKYVGRWYERADEEGAVIEDIRVSGYDAESDRYLCEHFIPGDQNEGVPQETWEDGGSVRTGSCFNEPVAQVDDDLYRQFGLWRLD